MRHHFVLDGKLIVKEVKKEIVAEQGDVVFIPKNTKYNFQGTFRAVVINSPAFDAKFEKIKE